MSFENDIVKFLEKESKKITTELSEKIQRGVMLALSALKIESSIYVHDDKLVIHVENKIKLKDDTIAEIAININNKLEFGPLMKVK